MGCFVGENVNSILAHHIFNSRIRPCVGENGSKCKMTHSRPLCHTYGLFLELNIWWARIELTFSPTILRHQSLYFDDLSTVFFTHDDG